MDYKIRKLCADDIFTLCDIFGKCGVTEFKNCFLKSGNQKNSYAVGVNVVFEITGVICKNIFRCKNEIYSFVADLCGVSQDELRKISPKKFAQLLKEIMRQEDMKDFFMAVSEFFVSDK